VYERYFIEAGRNFIFSFLQRKAAKKCKRSSVLISYKKQSVDPDSLNPKPDPAFQVNPDPDPQIQGFD
jgi:hypothetical protein